MFSKICLSLALCLSLTVAFRIDASVNKTQIQSIVNDWLNYDAKHEPKIQRDSMEMGMKMQGIFEDAFADVLGNYAKTVQPVAQGLADALKSIVPNEKTCKRQCVTNQCFNPQSWSLDINCVMMQCGCQLKDA